MTDQLTVYEARCLFLQCTLPRPQQDIIRPLERFGVAEPDLVSEVGRSKIQKGTREVFSIHCMNHIILYFSEALDSHIQPLQQNPSRKTTPTTTRPRGTETKICAASEFGNENCDLCSAPMVQLTQPCLCQSMYPLEHRGGFQGPTLRSRTDL